jgi:hypothetical protein
MTTLQHTVYSNSVLLLQYFGTGHFTPHPDDHDDCTFLLVEAAIITINQ